jgi:hypothetical protein
MEGEMILGKRILNQVEKMIKQKIGINPDAQKIRRLENEIRTLQGKVYNLENMAHSKRELIERDGKYYLKEENG